VRIIFTILFFLIALVSNGQQWIANTLNVTSGAYCTSIERHLDGLILAGIVDSINGVEGNGLFYFDGTSYNALGGGINTNTLFTTSNDSIVLIGGGFVNETPLITDKATIWSGASYKKLGSASDGYFDDMITGSVNAVIIHNDHYYCAGSFNYLPAIGTAPDIACYDSINGWNDMGGGFDHSTFEHVWDMVIFRDTLIIGGLLPYGNYPAINLNHIGKWNGTEWEKLDDGVGYTVSAMHVDTMNNFLYSCGSFTSASGLPAQYIAKWDGYNWSNLNGGLNAESLADGITMYQNDLYVSGWFTEADGQNVNYIARWDGENWFDLDGGLNGNAVAMEEYQDTLWISGGFDTISYGVNDIPSERFAKWYFPPSTHCNWLQALIYVNSEATIYQNDTVPFYNNNAHAASWDWIIDGTPTYSNYAPTHTFADTGWHDVEIIVTQDGCIDTALVSVYVEEPVGVEEPEQIEFKIYPNPSSGRITIQLNQNDALRQAQDDILILTVRDLQGKLVLSQTWLNRQKLGCL
jgi:hypothetical protein